MGDTVKYDEGTGVKKIDIAKIKEIEEKIKKIS